MAQLLMQAVLVRPDQIPAVSKVEMVAATAHIVVEVEPHTTLGITTHHLVVVVAQVRLRVVVTPLLIPEPIRQPLRAVTVEMAITGLTTVNTMAAVLGAGGIAQ